MRTPHGELRGSAVVLAADGDSSRGFMGQARFERLLRLLPPDVDVVGIDEHTALMLDFAARTAVVFGRGGVSWLHAETVTRLDAGAPAPLASVG